MTSTDGSGPRPTKQRLAVLEALGSVDDFRSAQEVHEILSSFGSSVGLATVYRTLQLYADQGDVDVLRREDGEAIYRRCSETHHHHLVCRSCGDLVDVPCATGDAPCLVPTDAAGYDVDEAEVIYWGFCPACRARSTGT